jgi:fumarate reductase (CoM/CoB) subunit A
MKSQKFTIKKCDVLVIGGGGSGVLAAIEASTHKNLKIILASKGPIGQSGLTPTANGGTALPASVDEMVKEMVTGGSFLNDQKIVWFMANEIQNAIEKLKQFGIPIISYSPTRVCVPGPETLQILRRELIKRPNVELFEDTLISSLIKSDGRIVGATALDFTTGEFFAIEAKATIIATGGYAGELYPHTSNNPFGVTTDASGTGHAMAYLAGAELIDMEMIQFVPLPANPQCLHLRYFPDFWAGPYTNRHGDIVESNVDSYPGKSYSHQFVQKLFRELEKGNGPMFIDQRDLQVQAAGSKVKSWDQRRKLFKALRIDPHENKIEIIIGSHFGMGGIRVNEKTETTIMGLFAAGEVMGGVHGGMRIPGYSFTQMIVFGFETGKQAAHYALEHQRKEEFSQALIEHEKEKIFHVLAEPSNPLSIADLKKQLQQVMQDHVFVVRDKEGLEKAIRVIRAIKRDVSRISVPNFCRFNLEWARSIEFALMVDVAEVIVESAQMRQESRGAHYRNDFPHEDNDRWLKHTVTQLKEGQLKLHTSSIEFYRMKPEASS